MLGMQFKFKVGQRVIVTYPSGTMRLGRIVDRTIEGALGKTYKIQSQRGWNMGYQPEEYLSLR